jgi:hypothetical protein
MSRKILQLDKNEKEQWSDKYRDIRYHSEQSPLAAICDHAADKQGVVK